MKTETKINSLVGLMLLGSIITMAQASSDALLKIQHQWAVCQYDISDENPKINCLKENIIVNENALKNTPESNELKTWLAINISTMAGVKGGLGALSLAKESKVLLEEVIASDPTVLDGSAYTSLGSLYYQVPGWPIGFGDDDTAEIMLKKALELNPDGIDPNYFYADFLQQDGRKKEAIEYFKHAQLATPRLSRPLADKGRLQEINNKLKEL